LSCIPQAGVPGTRRPKLFFDPEELHSLNTILKKEAAARRKAEIDRHQGVPFAVINGKGIHGYNVKAYFNALKQSYHQD
jgi:hypothetical protein